MNDADAEEEGYLQDDYTVLKLIGQGAFGNVKLAQHDATQIPVRKLAMAAMGMSGII